MSDCSENGKRGNGKEKCVFSLLASAYPSSVGSRNSISSSLPSFLSFLLTSYLPLLQSSGLSKQTDKALSTAMKWRRLFVSGSLTNCCRNVFSERSSQAWTIPIIKRHASPAGPQPGKLTCPSN